MADIEQVRNETSTKFLSRGTRGKERQILKEN